MPQPNPDDKYKQSTINTANFLRYVNHDFKVLLGKKDFAVIYDGFQEWLDKQREKTEETNAQL